MSIITVILSSQHTAISGCLWDEKFDCCGPIYGPARLHVCGVKVVAAQDIHLMSVIGSHMLSPDRPGLASV